MMADKTLMKKHSLRKLRKSKSTGMLKIEKTSVSISKLTAPVNFHAEIEINIEKYKIKGKPKDSQANVMKKTHSFKEKVTDSFRKKKTADAYRPRKHEGTICSHNAGHTPSKRRPSLVEMDIRHSDQSVGKSPSNIPSWPQKPTGSARKIIDPLGKADKTPSDFVRYSRQSQLKENVVPHFPEMLTVEAGHTPPIPKRWQVGSPVMDRAKKARLTELNGSLESKQNAAQVIGSAVKSAGKKLSLKRKSSVQTDSEKVLPAGYGTPALHMKKARFQFVGTPCEGRFMTTNAGCTPPKANKGRRSLPSKAHFC